MTNFQYKAVTTTGELLQGVMEAASHNEAIIKIQKQGYIPISAKASDSYGLNQFFLNRHGISQQQIAVLTQQLATMLDAGLPLDRALQLLVDLAETAPLQKRLNAILERVQDGASLSTALDSQDNMFPRLYINMVRAGEMGSTLESTLMQLADYLSRSQALKNSVISALIYPILLMIMAAGSLILLLVYVVPEFAPMFKELGGNLPMVTKVVLAAGAVLQHYWWALLLAITGLFFFTRQQLGQPTSRLRWDQRLLNTRWLGDLISKIEMARFARTLGTLMVNGVPVLRALSIAANVMSNTVLKGNVMHAADKVKSGDSLAASLAKEKHFPNLALQMILVGEETGQLDKMLIRVADAYDLEVKTTIDRLLALFVPVLTIILAVIIATIVMSLLMAILSINDLFI